MKKINNQWINRKFKNLSKSKNKNMKINQFKIKKTMINNLIY
jgi:hypothetical protein